MKMYGMIFIMIINHVYLTNQHIKQAIIQFNDFINSFLKEDQLVLIQFKIIDNDDQFKSISYLQTTNKSKLQDLVEIFIEFWQNRSNEYYVIIAATICLTFKIVPLRSNGSLKSYAVKHVSIEDSNNLNYFKFYGFSLPNSKDFTKWSDCELEWLNQDYTQAILYKLDSDTEYHITLFYDYTQVQLIAKEQIIFEFKDIIGRSGDLYSFKIIVKNQAYYYIDDELVMKTLERPTKFMSKGRRSAFRSNKLITMDIETRNINNVLTPYCIFFFFLTVKLVNLLFY